MDEEREFKWKSIIWSAILTFIIPFAVQMLIPTIAATITGFQTRGDNVAINETVMAVVKSFWFMPAVYLSCMLVAFWRGRVLASKTAYRPEVHALIAVGIGAGLFSALVLLGYGPVFAIPGFLVALGAAYLGAYLGKGKTVEG